MVSIPKADKAIHTMVVLNKETRELADKAAKKHKVSRSKYIRALILEDNKK